MIVIDTSVVYALLDGNDSLHLAAKRWYAKVADELVTTPLIVAEVDHLAGRAGAAAVDGFRRDLRSGAITIDWSHPILEVSLDVAEQYRDLGIGLAEASLVALAAAHQTALLATFDERHFRAIRPTQGGAFSLLPIDAQGAGL